MSKMYEALTRGQHAVPGLDLRQLMGEEDAVISTPAAPSLPEPEAQVTAVNEIQHEIASLPPSLSLDLNLVRTLPLRLAPSAPLLPFDGSDPRAGEQYRILRTKVLQSSARNRMIVVTSSGPNDGKTVTVINLAGALALRSDARVLILDADFRRSTIMDKLGFPPASGLAEVLEGHCQVHDAIVHVQQIPNLYVLPSGTPKVNPSELIDSPTWTTLCRRLRATFTHIIVDSPPVAAVADYDLIQASCDGVILVARPDHTNRAQCLKMLGLVPKDKLIGMVMNCAAGWFLRKDHRYEYYNYSAHTESPQMAETR
ncbi:MAG TPA: CpsD/CapB family tyrosine-protein kinase [Bryobacteraceae bacterium]|nr:CpsD/CapB family tyrosine-protein kinase [Bryobacteraceae bacterium]